MKVRVVSTSLDGVIAVCSSVEKADESAKQCMEKMSGKWELVRRASPPFGGPYDAVTSRWEQIGSYGNEWVAWETHIVDFKPMSKQ